MAHNFTSCFKCPYCILSFRDDLIERNPGHPLEYDNNVPPPIKSLPVSINNYFGDPFIQKEDTFKKLGILEKNEHEGIVAIITKSRINDEIIERLNKFNLNLQNKTPYIAQEYKDYIESLDATFHSVPTFTLSYLLNDPKTIYMSELH